MIKIPVKRISLTIPREFESSQSALPIYSFFVVVLILIKYNNNNKYT